MSKEILVDTKLNMFEYLALVDDLANGYFGEDGEYTPHYGLINTMGQFYNNCVTSSPWDETIPRPVTDASELAPILEDEDFLAVYNKALEHMYDETKFDFATALVDALDIVHHRSDSLEYSIQRFKDVCTDLIDQIAPMFSGLDMDSLNEITDKLQALNITKESLTDDYIAKMKQEAQAEVKAGSKNKDNVVPMKK